MPSSDGGWLGRARCRAEMLTAVLVLELKIIPEVEGKSLWIGAVVKACLVLLLKLCC